ncbi:GlcG/HbpS family heme-binding protein [Pseudomonas sp. SH1-B]
MHPLVQQQPSLSLTLAMHALQAALQHAEHLGVRISIALVDAGGQLIHMAHMDGAALLSRDIALNKARTALSFNLSTSAWQERLQRCSEVVRNGLPLQPGMALFGGGEPLRLGEQALGAIGISGASEAQDGECARAAQQAVQARLQVA